MLPDGLYYVADIITPTQEAELLAQFAVLRLESLVIRGQRTKRRVHRFGWEYHTTTKQLTKAQPMPAFLRALCQTCCAHCAIDAEFQQASVIQYPPGAGIGKHIDVPRFGHTIVGISLAAPATMRFRRSKDGVSVDLVLAPRSLLVMRGPSRWEWMHEIVATSVKHTRWSVTFRSVPQ
jgi:alkylated DNA repair dioxygenase AlkB